jgi:methyl-accepting chemotaxis protein
MNRVNVKARGIYARQTADAVRKLSASMDEVARISEESTSTIKQDSFAAQQQAATVQELTSEIYELVDVTQELVDALSRVHGARD